MHTKANTNMLFQPIGAFLFTTFFPVFFWGNGTETITDRWEMTRLSVHDEVTFTTNPNEPACEITFKPEEHSHVYDVVKSAWLIPGGPAAYQYQTNSGGFIEAHSDDGIYVKVQSYSTLPTDTCRIMLVADMDGSLTGSARREVQWLLTAIGEASGS